MVSSPVSTKKYLHLAYGLHSSVEENNSNLRNEILNVEKLIEWDGTPFFSRIARSAINVFNQPITLSSTGRTIKAAKIKGVGAKTHTGQIIQPTTTALHNNNPHLGFAGDKFKEVYTKPAPIGGITLERAKREFEVAKALNEKGCPSIVPLRVYKYSDPKMVFSPDDGVNTYPLGVVVTGLPNDHDVRVDSVFNYDSASIQQKAIVDSWIGHFKLWGTHNPQLSLIAKLSKMYGTTIRKFSEAGFFRYSGAPDNYSYDTDNNEVFLIDLDSSLQLNTILPIRQSLEVMRDVASGIAYLVAFLTNPKYIQRFPIEDVCRENPFRELLSGYYHDVEPDYIERLSTLIIQYYEKVYLHSISEFLNNSTFSKKSPAHIQNVNSDRVSREVREFKQFLSQSYMRPWISRNEAFSHIMPLCLLLHKSSSLMDSFSEVISVDDMLSNIRDYCCSDTAERLSEKIHDLLS